MAEFPKLKTGVIAQYPADRTRSTSTRVCRFLDGTEQRFQRYPAAVRKWTIRLDLLDEAELAVLRGFFEQTNGRWGTFSFTDPFDGSVAANCSFGSDAGVFELAAAGRARTELTIKENRS